jgi:hypothetical protein
VRENLEMGAYVERKREAMARNFERVMGLLIFGSKVRAFSFPLVSIESLPKPNAY